MHYFVTYKLLVIVHTIEPMIKALVYNDTSSNVYAKKLCRVGEHQHRHWCMIYHDETPLLLVYIKLEFLFPDMAFFHPHSNHYIETV